MSMKMIEQRTLDAFLLKLRHLDVRLWVEGDRLRYKAAKNTLTPELLAELRDLKTEIVAFLKSASLATDPNASTIPVISREGNLPLSIAQERLWYHHQFEPNSSLNNIITAYRLKGKLDIELLDHAQHEIVQRHEILRTTFPKIDGKPTVAISTGWKLKIPIEDLQSVPVIEREEEAHRRAIAESRRPYNLEQGPLLRLCLLKLSPDDYLLVLTMHRMMADGVSVDIFFREMVTLYEAYLTGKPAVLPELPIQYVDYANWQRQRLQREFLETHLHYWKEHLQSPLPVINLPVSYPRPSTYSFNTLRRRLIFPKALNDALNKLSQQEGSTLFMTLIAALKVLLYRYSEQEDVIICCSNAGRNQAEIQSLVGPFFNTLALRTHLDGNPTFRDVIQRVKQVTLGAFAHQELPFEQLVPELNIGKNRGRSSLFQVFFALNPSWKDGNTLSTVDLPDITFDTMFGYLYTGKTKFDLFLVMREAEEGLQLLFEYNSDLFDGEIVLPMMDHYKTLLESAVADPDQQISQLSLLTPEEKQQLLVSWSDTKWEYSSPYLPNRPGTPINLNLPKTKVYILDREYQPVPIGAIGELYTDEAVWSQASLRLSNQSNTVFSFPSSSPQDGIRLCKTGEVARYRPGKIIELLNNLNDELLIEKQMTQSESTTYVASRDDVELQLTHIWEEVFNVQPIGIQDNFFDLGGHSILAVRLFTQIEQTLGKDLPLSILLQAPTIEQLAYVLRKDNHADVWSPLVEIQAGNPNKTPLFCIHGGGFNVLIYRNLAFNLHSEQPVYGLQAQGLSGRGGVLANSLTDIAADYINEIRNIQPYGPYCLCGLSNGGNIALEMAQQLQAQGEEIALLAMFDTYAPEGIKLLPPCSRFASSLGYVVQHSLPRFATKMLSGELSSINVFSQLQSRKEESSPESAHKHQSITNSADSSSKRSLEDWMNEFSQYVLEHSPWAFFSPKAQLQGVDGSISERLQQMEERYKEIHTSYTLKPYSGQITVFRAKECPPGHYIDRYLGWNEFAQGRVTVYKIPGDHTSIMISPVLAKTMQNCLNSIEQGDKYALY